MANQPTAHEVRTDLVDRMRRTGLDPSTATREAEASVRRVSETNSKKG